MHWDTYEISQIVDSMASDLHSGAMTWEMYEKKLFAHAPSGSGGKLDKVPGPGKIPAQISKRHLLEFKRHEFGGSRDQTRSGQVENDMPTRAPGYDHILIPSVLLGENTEDHEADKSWKISW